MIDAISNPELFAGGIGAPATRSTQLDRDAFLRLLVTQLRHQDPTRPLDAHEFAAQLAQFSSVEQLAQLNDVMASQVRASELASLLSQTSFASALVGRHVTVAGDQVVVPPGGEAAVRVDVGEGGGVARLRLFDEQGREVAARDLGTLEGGRHTLALPADLPSGTWRYAVEVTGPGGDSVPVVTYTSGVVSAIEFRGGGVLLRIGTLEVSLADLAEVSASPPAATPSGPPVGFVPAGPVPPAPLPPGPPPAD